MPMPSSRCALFAPSLLLFFILLCPEPGYGADGVCERFTGSTMIRSGVEPATWRMDFEDAIPSSDRPWLLYDFTQTPELYMASILDLIRPYFKREEAILVGPPDAQWWISPWMDVGANGREPLAGLTRERRSDPGDLAEASAGGDQVWAVGFYNAAGATTLGTVFADPCEPSIPNALLFPEGTVSVKFLFTTASPDVVTYLDGAPIFEAFIDPPQSNGEDPVAGRVRGSVRPLQLDIAVKDNRAAGTGWVFGTFVWVGPPKGASFLDNFVPLSLQWGNDPGRYNEVLHESWVNEALSGRTHGWTRRPFLGFKGRANGPADNWRSSCLSCHGNAARLPRAGMVNSAFSIEDLADPVAVEAMIDVWFKNIAPGEIFRPERPARASVDYSLQLEAAVTRLCQACSLGFMPGKTPTICRETDLFEPVLCTAATAISEGRSGPPARQTRATGLDFRAYRDEVPPRQ